MNFRLDRKRVFILLRTGRCVNGGGGEWGGKMDVESLRAGLIGKYMRCLKGMMVGLLYIFLSHLCVFVLGRGSLEGIFWDDGEKKNNCDVLFIYVGINYFLDR